jgi:diguanylate cyclase (GGDEF)-like protein
MTQTMFVPYALNTFLGSALIIILIFIDCLVKYTNNIKQKRFFCIFLIITFLFLFTDVFISMLNETESIKLYWPFITALLLYIYLFIVLKESKIDSLTGLNNRNSFFEFFGKFSYNQTGERWAVVLLDINNFKSINSIYGHLEGDNALISLACIIKNNIKKTDFAARYGGDEFILITKAENNIDNLMAVIIEKLDIHNRNTNKPYSIEISYGTGLYAADGSMSIDEILSRIDTIMKKSSEENRRVGDI